MPTEEQSKLAEQLTAATPATPVERVTQLTATLIKIDGRRYEIVADYRQAFDRERLAERYNDVLAKYDYIVGDWGYDQLRLRGFYQNDAPHANKDQLIGTLQDYLYEYCNFGCAYFVIQRLDAPETKPRRRARQPRRAKRDTRRPYQEKAVQAVSLQGQHAETVAPTKPRKRHFKIRSRESHSEK